MNSQERVPWIAPHEAWLHVLRMHFEVSTIATGERIAGLWFAKVGPFEPLWPDKAIEQLGRHQGSIARFFVHPDLIENACHNSRRRSPRVGERFTFEGFERFSV